MCFHGKIFSVIAFSCTFPHCEVTKELIWRKFLSVIAFYSTFIECLTLYNVFSVNLIFIVILLDFTEKKSIMKSCVEWSLYWCLEISWNQFSFFFFTERTHTSNSSWIGSKFLSEWLETDFGSLPYCSGSQNQYV